MCLGVSWCGYGPDVPTCRIREKTTVAYMVTSFLNSLFREGNPFSNTYLSRGPLKYKTYLSAHTRHIKTIVKTCIIRTNNVVLELSKRY